MSQLFGVVQSAQLRRLVVDAAQCERWPRPAPVAAPSTQTGALPLRAETASALADARRLGRRYWLVTRD